MSLTNGSGSLKDYQSLVQVLEHYTGNQHMLGLMLKNKNKLG
jgi:hypothetical protein